MKESIRDIKLKLAQVCSEEELLPYLSDRRAGVKLLVQSAQKAIAKKHQLKLYLKEMKHYEDKYYQKGYRFIAGVDEVGRGPLAGPVVSAAVILPPDFSILGVNDSKKMSEKKRESLFEQIINHSISHGFGIVEPHIIDRINIYEATKVAMNQALDALSVDPEFTLIDAMPLKRSKNELSLIKGDSKSISIAAASILAKVMRDRLMTSYDAKYPGYGFKENKGYGTKSHLEGLAKHGACPIHRLSFAPVKHIWKSD